MNMKALQYGSWKMKQRTRFTITGLFMLVTFWVFNHIQPGQARSLIPEVDPAITSWKRNTTGATGMSPNQTIHDCVSQYLADVSRVRYNATDVYINSESIPSHNVGPFPDGNPATPVGQDYLFMVPRDRPEAQAVPPEPTGLGNIGVFVNGVTMFNYLDATSYQNQGSWNQNAIVARANGFDSGLGHPAPGQTGPHPTPPLGVMLPHPASTGYIHSHHGLKGSLLHGHDKNGIHPVESPGAGPVNKNATVEGAYHYHQQPVLLREQLGDDGTGHSPVLGWVFDGVPIYGPYGYDNPDGTGGVRSLDPGYQMRNISNRQTLPDGTVLSPGQYGPAVDSTYPLGYYVEDFEYVDGLGDLDEYNGRFGVTPEYPGGVYAYFATIDNEGSSAFPYLLGPNYYASVIGANLNQTVSVPPGAVNYEGHSS